MLHAERIEQQRIIATYRASALLSPLIEARLLLNRDQPEQAERILTETTTPLFELVEILKIEIALKMQHYAEALERLDFLTVQPLSVWLHPIQDAYQLELLDKWLQFSQFCPWCIFKATHQPQFNTEQNSVWLQALLEQSQHATDEEQQLLLRWYITEQTHIQQYEIQDKLILLKLMSQFDVFNSNTFQFAQDILQQRFIPEVLYIWLDHALNHANVPFVQVEQQIQYWQEQYPSQPSLSFAKWHIL
ncbi:hypothetical protein GWI33_009984, partial [Rhynchophorus ferrugineus]